jgi:hypothetical protein
VRARALLVAFCAAVACRSLPSAVPLSDLGGAVPAPGANDRDRRSVTLAEKGAGGEAGEEIVVTAEAKASIPASDAGVADSGPDAAVEKSAGASLQWPGEYYGSDRFVRRMESQPDDVQVDDKARTRVEQPSPSSLLISVVNSLTGDVICALKAGVQGAEATLEPGQSCFAGEGLEAEVTSGQAKLSGDTLTLDFEGKVEGEDEDEQSSGKDTYHFEGRRR